MALPSPLLFSVMQELVRLFGILLESFNNHRLSLIDAFPSTTPSLHPTERQKKEKHLVFHQLFDPQMTLQAQSFRM